jgi:hypothetical protein
MQVVVAALMAAVLPEGGRAVEPPRPLDAPGAVVVWVQPRNRYVVHLNARGKDERTMRREISQAVHIACILAPSTGNLMDTRPHAVSTCRSQASRGANLQLRRILKARKQISGG